MSCIAIIEDLIFSLALPVYTTAHFLAAGTPDAMYSAIAELKRRGVIRGDSYGVYSRTDAPPPTAEQIAAAKAERFGKRIFSCEPSEPNRFITDGCQTSFNTKAHGRIYFSHAAAKKRKEPLFPGADSLSEGQVSTTQKCSRFVEDKHDANRTIDPLKNHSELEAHFKFAVLLKELLELLPQLARPRKSPIARRRRMKNGSFSRTQQVFLRNLRRIAETWRSKLEDAVDASRSANTS